MKLSTEQGTNISLSSIISAATVLGVVWMFVKPALMANVSVALADDIKGTVKREVAPISAGFTVLLQQQILQTQREIAQLERQRNANFQTWTSEQATTLVDAYSRLEAQKMALEALR
jgi:hypothetical protein